MLYSDLEQLIKKASCLEEKQEELEKVSSDADEIDNLVKEIDQELNISLEKRASKVGIAKLLTAIDILQ